MHSTHLIAGIEPRHCESTPGWDAHQTGAIGHSATVLQPVCSAGVHKPAVQLCEAFQLGWRKLGQRPNGMLEWAKKEVKDFAEFWFWPEYLEADTCYC